MTIQDEKMPVITDRPETPPELSDDFIDELLAGARTADEIAGEGGLLQTLTKRLIERAMDAELTDHLGYPRGAAPLGGAGNVRNGTSPKTLHTEHGSVRIEQPRDRVGSFEPQIVSKHQRRFSGFDEKIIAMYARGMTVRDIQAHLAEIYGVRVGHDLISTVTDTVLEDVKAWQSRPLEDVYPVLYLDALVVKIRDGGAVRRKACYVVMGVNLDGERDVLGLWIQASEGAKFWMSVLTELKQRGVQDVLIACVDGLRGFPEAIEAVFPATWVQTCIVHLIRNSLRFVPEKHRRQVAKALRPIYTAANADDAKDALETLDADWGARYPMITKTGRDAWEQVIPFLGSRPTSAASSTRPTASKRCTAKSARRSRPAGTSRPKTPPASSSTCRSSTPRRPGERPTTGTRRSPPSRSTSETDCPNHQTRPHPQKLGHPPGAPARAGHRASSTRPRGRDASPSGRRCACPSSPLPRSPRAPSARARHRARRPR
jgi:putative transposase